MKLSTVELEDRLSRLEAGSVHRARARLYISGDHLCLSQRTCEGSMNKEENSI